MTRKRSRLALLVGSGSTCAAVLAFAACGGKDLSIGNDTIALHPVDLATVFSSAPGVCEANFAHPNVCCQAGPGQAASCGDYPSSPFQACPPEQNTYPNPSLCCPLASPDDPSGCVASPPPTSGGQPGGSSCVYPCLPGWYEPQGQPGTCCQTTGGNPGATVCEAQVTPACVENCPPCAPEPGDAGFDAAACACTETCPSAPACDPCPPGWQVPSGPGGGPGLCCQTQPNSVIDCFSQAVPPPIPTNPVDAGPDVLVGPPPPQCASINLTNLDRACTQDSDCVLETGVELNVQASEVCSNICECGVDSVNVSSNSAWINAYATATAQLPPSGVCSCPTYPMAACVNNTCTTVPRDF
jgi:hypothetical protein